MTKKTFKTRIIAGVLSVITVFSIGTTALAASASAASLPSTGSEEIDAVLNIEYQGGLGAIRELVPGVMISFMPAE